MDELGKHSFKCKKPVIKKTHIISFHLYERSRIGECNEIEIGLVFTQGYKVVDGRVGVGERIVDKYRVTANRDSSF